MKRDDLKNIFIEAGYKSPTAYSFLNGNRQLFTDRQIKLLKKVEKGEVDIKSLLTIPLKNDSQKTQTK